MHSLKFAVSVLVGCVVSITVAAAGVGNVAHGIQVEARREIAGPLAARQVGDPGPCGAGPGVSACIPDPPQAVLGKIYTTVPVSDLINAMTAKDTEVGGPSISARQAPIEATVTVTVTTTPDYCNTATSAGIPPVSASAGPSNPASGSATPSIGSASPSITGPAVIIPIPVSTPGAGPVSAGTSTALPMSGNITMATSSISSTGSSTSSASSTVSSSSASNSAPATSSPSAPKSNGSDSKDFYGILLVIAIAVTGNVALLI